MKAYTLGRVDTAITILIFGIVGLSAIACVAALVVMVGQRTPSPPRADDGPGPAHEQAPVDEAWAEARAVVDMRNARRRRRGEPETDPDVEAAEILRALEDGTG